MVPSQLEQKVSKSSSQLMVDILVTAISIKQEEHSPGQPRGKSKTLSPK
jgi:hypothetical protein